jgi:hypothetical protein
LQREFLEKLVQVLERAATAYAITGSIASNYWGIPRFTHDLDILVVIDSAQARQIAAAFPDPFYVSAEAAAEAAVSRNMFNIINTVSGFKADLWVSAGDPFNQSMLSRRRRVEIVPGQEAYVGSPEDVLLHKLVWHKITPSERQLADAAGIAVVQAGSLDLAYLRGWAVRQSTADLLEEVLQGKYLKRT